MTPAEILRAAREKIEMPENWCQRASAFSARNTIVSVRSDEACRWCASGAIASLPEADGQGVTAAWGFLNEVALDFGYDGNAESLDPFVVLNDRANHPTVLRMFSRAIELAEQEESA